jgi:Domain of unknown function (DUF397)
MGKYEGLRWTKSSLSQEQACVEWAVTDDGCGVHVRDSKDPDGSALRFTRAEWDAFVGGVKRGEADLTGS